MQLRPSPGASRHRQVTPRSISQANDSGDDAPPALPSTTTTSSTPTGQQPTTASSSPPPSKSRRFSSSSVRSFLLFLSAVAFVHWQWRWSDFAPTTTIGIPSAAEKERALAAAVIGERPPRPPSSTADSTHGNGVGGATTRDELEAKTESSNTPDAPTGGRNDGREDVVEATTPDEELLAAASVDATIADDDRGGGDAPPSPVYLVTGAAGYIGSHMSLKLLESNYTVVGVDNLSRGSRHALSVLEPYRRFSFVHLDLGDSKGVNELFDKHDFTAVFHFAAIAFTLESVEFPDLYKRNITDNTATLVDAMIRTNVPKLVYSSTCATYGSSTEFPITERTPTNPMSPYGRTKLDAEEYIRSKVSSTFTAHVLRYFNVVGSDPKGRLWEHPRRNLSRYARLWTACMDIILGRRECVELHETKLDTIDGTAVRDYVHVDDLVRAHLAVLPVELPREKEKYAETWNVGGGSPTSTLQFVESVRRISGVHIPICFGNRETHAAPELYATTEKLYNATGWTPRFTNMDETLRTAWRTFEASATLRHQKHAEKKKSSTRESRKVAAPPLPWDWKAKEYDVCVIGAGLAGSILAERHANVRNRTVLLLDDRDRVGGECHDSFHPETRLRVGTYGGGPRFVYGSDERVWKYLNEFGLWRNWEGGGPSVRVGGEHVPLLPLDGNRTNESRLDATDAEKAGLAFFGKGPLYEETVKPYITKRWGLDPKELSALVYTHPPFLLGRTAAATATAADAANGKRNLATEDRRLRAWLPVDGYSRFFENLSRSTRITVKVNVDYFAHRSNMKCGRTYFAGPIEEYFSGADSKLPRLDRRCASYDRVVYGSKDRHQPTATVIHPDEGSNCTASVEYKHLWNRSSARGTVVDYETWTTKPPSSEGARTICRIVPSRSNLESYRKYQKLAKEVEKEGRVTFVVTNGLEHETLDRTVLRALELFDRSA